MPRPSKGSSFKIEFEGSPTERIKLKAYAFNRNGKLVEEVDLKNEEFKFKTNASTLRRLKVFVAPVPPKELGLAKPTMEDLIRIKAYEPRLKASAADKFTAFPIPIVLSDFWKWRACRVRGKVVKPVAGDGSSLDLPVCGARVHICEVDKITLIIPRIPDDIIFRLRDDLLRPTIPVPDPFPLPEPIPDPLPPVINPTLISSLGGGLNVDSGFGSSVIPNRLSSLKGISSKSELLKLDFSRKEFSVKPAEMKLPVLSTEIKNGLSTGSANQIRAMVVDNIQILHPYFCIFPWFWPYFYSCQELAVVDTDANGQFDTYIWYQIFGDKPDLYFWVEYNIDGIWTTVYRPPIPCYTYWDYNCSSEVSIRVTDPRVLVCGELPSPDGLVVNIVRIGSAAEVSHISQNINGVTNINGVNQKNVGLLDFAGGSNYRRPFAQNLGLVVHFGTQLIPNGITHYKWSYRKVKDNNLVDLAPGNTDLQWKVMDSQVNIYYREEDRNVSPPKVSVKPYRLGPDENFTDPIFKIPFRHPDLVPDLPPKANVDRDWVSLNFSSGVLDSTFGEAMIPAPNRAAFTAGKAGLYEFKLELFKIVSGVPQLQELNTGAFQHPDPTDISEFIPAPHVNLVSSGANKATAYKMFVRIDNNRCTADIKEVTVNGVPASPQCGFVQYNDKNDNVRLSFEASHPNNFATFSFTTVRGSGNGIDQATDSGHVITHSSNGDFTLAGGLYSAEVQIKKMLTILPVPPNPPFECDNGAFAEYLYVDSLATNGSSTNLSLDASDLEAFALEFEPVVVP